MKKIIWMVGLLLSSVVLPAWAEQAMKDMAMPGMQMQDMQIPDKQKNGMQDMPMSGMQNMQTGTKTEQAQGIGRVDAIDTVGLLIKLTHEPIKTLGWPSMTMQFKVAGAALLNGIKPGDAVTFELAKDVQTGAWVVTGIAPQKKNSPSTAY